MKRICIYCGSRSGKDPIYTQKAIEVGQLLAQNNIELVYGGGNVGIMKTVADAVLENGGNVIGVIPRKLRELELEHPNITECYVTESMHERKFLMSKLADGFIALPGGWGTLEEMSEAVTWTQLNYQDKPTGILNTNNYYGHLLNWLQHAQQEGFISKDHTELLIVETNPTQLLQKMKNKTFPRLEDHL